jgi:L-aspartate oxidase
MQQPPLAGAMHGEVRDWTATPETSTAPAAAGAATCDEAGIRRLMWDAVGLERDRAGLERAIETLAVARAALDARPGATRADADWRFGSLATVGWLIARAALRRTESRGGHFRSDFPSRDDVHWSAHIVERSRHRSL